MQRHVAWPTLGPVRRWLAHPWLPGLAALLGMALTAPSLWNGFAIDDDYHRVSILAPDSAPLLSASPLELFRFADGDPETLRTYVDRGLFPWWTWENLQIAFFRPLASLTYRLDYALWPDSALAMHAQNLLWFGVAIVVVGLLHRAVLGATWVAGLATIAFAIDDAHGMTVGFLANRHALLATTFGLLALLGHLRWRTSGRPGFLAGAVGLLALALCAGEMGATTGGFLLAYAVCLDTASWRSRLLSLVPYGAVVLVWRGLYVWLDYGVVGSGMYIDAVGDPLRFAAAVLERGPVYVMGQFGFPPASAYLVLAQARPQLYALALLWTLAVAALVLPLLRRSAVARFWSVAFAFALLAICATQPDDRNLFFASVAGSGLFAQLVAASGRGGLLRRGGVALLLAIHLLLAPALLPLVARIPAKLEALVTRTNRTLSRIPDLGRREVIVVNTPSHATLVTFLVFQRLARGEAAPVRMRALASGPARLQIERLTERSLRLRAGEGALTGAMDDMFRSGALPFSPGDRVELRDVGIEVEEVDAEGRPSVATFAFDAPLEDARYVWLRADGGGYAPFRLPGVGESVALEPAQTRGPPGEPSSRSQRSD